MDFPVQRRYGDETLDIKEFIKPNTFEVRQLYNQLKNSNTQEFVLQSWDWVVKNIKYPNISNGLSVADRHYLEAYTKRSQVSKMIRNTLLSGVLSTMRTIFSGNNFKLSTLITESIIGNTILSTAENIMNGNKNIVPELKYTSFDFWNYPSETLRDMTGDCEDTSILLCSLLRNQIPSENVYVTLGFFGEVGHAWVNVQNVFESERILETTTDDVLITFNVEDENNPYIPIIRFNDTFVQIIEDIDNFIVH